MHLVQLLLPLYDDSGKLFKRGAFDCVARELSDRFGGATLYARMPATGLWKEKSGKTTRDGIVVCEVMLDAIDRRWWQQYRRRLEKVFAQDTVVVRAQRMVTL